MNVKSSKTTSIYIAVNKDIIRNGISFMDKSHTDKQSILNLSGTILKQLKDGEEIKCIH